MRNDCSELGRIGSPGSLRGLICPWLCLMGAMLAPLLATAKERPLEGLEEQAIKEAVALAEASLVRIETVGGLEQAS